MAGGSAVAFVAQTATAARTFRADIQGLRAVAVVLVVLNHAYSWPAGGFIGVDVFYVISGFLITGLLMRELEQTGSISLRAFYARRARRILPAAVLVLAVTVVLAFVLWFSPRALQTLLDAVSALLFVSNWHFIALGADYLQAGGIVSPVQHYWSLSIEEQFYAIWPLALLVLFYVLRRSRTLLIVGVGIAIALSLAWAAYGTSVAPTAAYFDTFTRVWELLAGAMLALIGTARERVGAGMRRIVAYAGLALIVVSAIVVQADWAVPFPWVLPAVIGAVALIWANATMGSASLLGNRVAQWLGDVSYSLYLWHFPVLIFAASVFGHSWWIATLCLPVMLVLSDLSRRFVEQPVMRGHFLARAAKLKNSRPFVARDLVFGVAVAVCITALAVLQLRGPVWLASASAAAERMGITAPAALETPVTPEQRGSDVMSALEADAWPDAVRGELDDLFASQLADALRPGVQGCRNSVMSTRPAKACGTPGGEEAMVVGDSVALAWAPTVVTLAAQEGWNPTAVGYANCSLFDVSARNGTDDPGFPEACARSREKMLALIEEHRPAVVFLSAAESALGYTDLPLDAAAAEWEAGVGRTLDRLADVPRVVILSNPPVGADPNECATRFGSPVACTSEVGETYARKLAAERTPADGHANTVVIDTREWFCTTECPAFIGERVQRVDASHLTEAAAVDVAPLLATALAELLRESQ